MNAQQLVDRLLESSHRLNTGPFGGAYKAEYVLAENEPGDGQHIISAWYDSSFSDSDACSALMGGLRASGFTQEGVEDGLEFPEAVEVEGRRGGWLAQVYAKRL